MSCAICGVKMLFEVPPCPDGHEDCPELVCTGCGAAEVLVPITLRVWRRPRGRVAPQQRRAAYPGRAHHTARPRTPQTGRSRRGRPTLRLVLGGVPGPGVVLEQQ